MTVLLSRRQVLIGGLGAMGAIALGAPSSASDLPAGAAYAPWQNWQDGTGTRGLVDPATLCANAHDTQPWLFCVHPDRIDLYADESRNLGAMDPFRREMRISLGCSLQNLILAARARGFDAHIAIDNATLTLPAPTAGAR